MQLKLRNNRYVRYSNVPIPKCIILAGLIAAMTTAVFRSGKRGDDRQIIMKTILMCVLFLFIISTVNAEFFVSIDTRLVGDETVLQEIVEIIKQEVDGIHDVTVLDSSDQASIILRFHIAEVTTEGGAHYGSVIHMSVLVPFQSANAGRQLLYIADDMGGAPPDEHESLIRDMIEDLDKLLENSR